MAAMTEEQKKANIILRHENLQKRYTQNTLCVIKRLLEQGFTAPAIEAKTNFTKTDINYLRRYCEISGFWEPSTVKLNQRRLDKDGKYLSLGDLQRAIDLCNADKSEVIGQ